MTNKLTHRPTRCIHQVSYSGGKYWKRCARYAEYGPDRSYCKLHWERLQDDSDTPDSDSGPDMGEKKE